MFDLVIILSLYHKVDIYLKFMLRPYELLRSVYLYLLHQWSYLYHCLCSSHVHWFSSDARKHWFVIIYVYPVLFSSLMDLKHNAFSPITSLLLLWSSAIIISWIISESSEWLGGKFFKNFSFWMTVTLGP